MIFSDLIRSAESIILTLQLLEVGLHIAQLRVQVSDLLPLLFHGALNNMHELYIYFQGGIQKDLGRNPKKNQKEVHSTLNNVNGYGFGYGYI